MQRFALLLIALALTTIACSSGDSAEGEWILDVIEINGVATSLPDNPIDLRVTAGGFTSSVGCNSLSGGISLGSDGSLEIMNAFSTEMSCSPRSLMEFESDYTSALLQSDSWAITDYLDDGKRLTFRGPDVAIYYLPAS